MSQRLFIGALSGPTRICDGRRCTKRRAYTDRADMRNVLKAIRRLPGAAIAIMFGIATVFVSVGIYRGGSALHNLFAENKELKQALTNLTDEGKIGYAKVLNQEKDPNGNVVSTTLKFVETARDNELETVLEKQYTVQGDIVHFDALIVKFGD